MIKIAVATYDNVEPATQMSAVFGQDRKTLGRSDDNFLVLPDPKHEVSRAQAAIWSDGWRHTLVNLSDATAIEINGREIEVSREVHFRVGDEIRIGPYMLRAEQHGDLPEGVSPYGPESVQPVVPDVGEAAEADDGAASPAAPALSAAASSLANASTTPVWNQAPAAMPVSSFSARSAPAPGAGPAAAPAPASAPVVVAVGAPAAVEPSPAEAAPVPELADPRALKDAFLRGAGIAPGAISSELTPELMELIGKLLAGSIQGAIDLMGQRSLVKQEVQADVTMVVLRDNNPLKFFPDSQTVLTQMLRKKMPGFMGPVEAITDTYHDLKGHQRGVVAGVRASMEAMLARLKPETFEAELKSPTFAESLMPSKRQAQLWELYLTQFQTVQRSKNEFKTLFGPPFLAAYEKEIERFDDGLKNDGSIA